MRTVSQLLVFYFYDYWNRPHPALDRSVRSADGAAKCIQERTVVLAFIGPGHYQVDGTASEVLGSDNVNAEHDLGHPTSSY